MRRLAYALLPIAVAVAQPALAADPATLGCAVDKVPANQRTSFAAASGGLVTGATSDGTNARTAIRDAARACAVQHGWNAAAEDAAFNHALAEIALEGIAPLAREAGLDPEDFAAAVADLEESDQQGLLSGDNNAAMALIGTLGKRGIEVGSNGTLIGAYAAVLIHRSSSRAKFVAA